MDLTNIKWNKTNYKKFISYLKKISDEKYKNFHNKIIGNKNTKIIGIKVPILKKIAKDISKGNYISFIKENTHIYYEEIMIHGLILGYLKTDEKSLIKLIDEFTIYIDNWAVCDTVCANLKQFKNININKLDKYLNNTNPWVARVGVVLLLDHYMEKENLEYIFNTCNNIKINHYYVKMAISWLISICYIKYPERTLKYLKTNDLDKFTHNKAISKICDSIRINKITKEELKKLKL